jgi:hypothetical protein
MCFYSIKGRRGKGADVVGRGVFGGMCTGHPRPRRPYP